jgi:hypothetical protein
MPDLPPATITNVKEDREMRTETRDTTVEVSVKRGSRARLELPAEVADRLELKDGDTIPALIGRTPRDIEYRVAVQRWVDEGADRPMPVEEFMDYLGRCPDPPE